MYDLASIIIVTYNCEQYIDKCLKSLQAQFYSPFEIIVYDNASTDETAEIVERDFSTVHLIKGQENLGFAAGNNAAVRQAKGEILVFINPDAYVQNDFLEPIVNFLKTSHDAGAVSPAILVAGRENFLNAYGNRIHLSGITYCYEYGRPNTRKDPFEVGAISGAAFAMRREIFEKLGGFEESFFMYYEDTDLSLRIRRMGLNCYVVPVSVVFHAFKENFHSNKVYYLERNRYLSLFSLFGFSSLALMLPSLMIMELITWGYCLMKGPVTLRAKLSSWQAVINKIGWIRARYQIHQLEPCKLNVLRGLDEHLELVYIGGGILTKVASLVAYLSALPSMALIRSIMDRKRR